MRGLSRCGSEEIEGLDYRIDDLIFVIIPLLFQRI